MATPLFLYFNGWGVLGLALFVFGYAVSHSFSIKGWKTLDLCAKVAGFVGLTLIFALSGWQAGLIAIPLGFIGSMIGAGIARALRGDRD